MKVVSVVGTRPNFCNKEMIMNRELKGAGINEILVHTGQHYDYNMSKIFFDELGIPEPDYHFNVNKGSGINQISEILIKMKEVLEKERPDVTLVYGDVVSTLAAAVASVKLKIPVAHVEAGIRAENIYNPEEINRRVSDVLSEILFAPVKSAYNNLIKENFKKENVYLTGDIVKDSLLSIIKKFKIKISDKGYILTTIHREENVMNKTRLTNIVKALAECEKNIIFPAHPRTRNKIREYGLQEYINEDKIKLLEPQGYIEFVKLLANAEKVFTDSGGVRREAYILGKPVIVPIKLKWFPEIFEAGWGLVVKPNYNKIKSALKEFNPHKKKKERPLIFGDGRAGKKIVRILKERYEK